MTAFRPLLLFLAVCWASAAAAVPTAAAPARTEQTDQVAIIEAEMAAYGQWLARLQEIEAPVQSQLGSLAPLWQAAQAEGGSPRAVAERFRPVVTRTLAAIDAANMGIEALDRPDYASLELPDDLRASAIAREMHELNRQIRVAIEAFNPLLDATANGDMSAVEQSSARMLSSLGLVLESQVVLARASLAATPRDDPSWHFGNIDLMFFRAGARVFGAFRPIESPRVDPALAPDLAALASELETNAEQGTQNVAAALALYGEGLEDARRQGDTETATIMRRAVAVFTAGQAYFPLSVELAALLRAEAALFRGRPTTMESVSRFFQRLRPFRVRMDEIGGQAVAALAAP